MDASIQTPSTKPPSDAASVSGLLLGWYDRRARDLPWRSPPGTPPPEPYRVWLSEIMLQQTTTAAVAPYFARFLAAWPTVEALAAADDGEVMSAWAGLGYYARARNLLACAREVAARGGAFPRSETELRQLPGIGAYTAAAVAAIAFGQRAVVVDANVERVVARLFAISEPLPAARPAIRRYADIVTPHRRAGDFAQAMMDLGATVCTARKPRCLLCPLADACRARAGGGPERYPVKAPRKARPERAGHAFWIERARGREVWLVRRPAKGMLGGMMALPDDGWSARADGHGMAPGISLPDASVAGTWHHVGTVSHGFTHFTLGLKVMLHSGRRSSDLATGQGEWWPLARIDEAGLPTLFARAAQLVLARRKRAEKA